MKARVTLSTILLLAVLLGVASCQKEHLETRNAELDQTTWTLMGYIDQDGVFEPLSMPEEWKDKSYNVFFEENKLFGTMPNGDLSYGRYQALKSGKWTFLEKFPRTDKNYGNLSERFMSALSNVYSYELSEDELKLISTEYKKGSSERVIIVMVFKKDKL